MTGKQRILNAMERKPLDRIPVFESFWLDTINSWQNQNILAKDELPMEHFDFDLFVKSPLNMTADINANEKIVEENETQKLVRTGNGALLRYWKNKCGTPEHIDFEVKNRSGWESQIRPLLKDKSLYEKRIDADGLYYKLQKKARQKDKFLCCGGLGVFECIHPVCGHEFLLMGMALDPEWIKDMCDVYSLLIIDLCEILFAKYGRPDGIWFYEDMGFKQKPFMSPKMYKAIIWPYHKRLIDWAHSYNMKVIMHSCGYIEPLIPALIEAGLDCLQAMEVKAGMDVIKLKKEYGQKLTLFGGLDIRVLETNNKDAIGEYLKSMIPDLKKNYGYILHTDHSIPDTVDYDTYRYFMLKGIELGSYN